MILRIFLCLLLAALATSCDQEQSQSDVPSMTCISYPPGAAILLEGDSTGFTTPHTFTHPVPGQRTVQFRLAGHRYATFRFHLIPGASITLADTLQDI